MLDPTMGSRSLTTYAEGYGLGRDDVATGWRHYLGSARPDAYAGPAGADGPHGAPAGRRADRRLRPAARRGRGVRGPAARGGRRRSTTYRAHGHVHSSHYLTRFLPSARRAVAWSTEALRRAYA